MMRAAGTRSHHCVYAPPPPVLTPPNTHGSQNATAILSLLLSIAACRCRCPAAADLEAWQRICWWEGPDSDGYLWLMIDFRAAVEASRTHGPELVARVLVSNVRAGQQLREGGHRELVPRSCEAQHVRL